MLQNGRKKLVEKEAFKSEYWTTRQSSNTSVFSFIYWQRLSWNIITIPSKATTEKSHKFPEKRHHEQKTHLDEFKCSLTVFRVSRIFPQLDLQKCPYKIQGSLKLFNSQDVIVDSSLYSCYTFPNKSITKCLMLDQDNKFNLISLSILIFCLLDALLIL